MEMLYIYTTEYYSTVKNEIMNFTGRWAEVETVILDEVTQT